MEHDIVITVSSKAGKGKTTIAQQITETLRGLGLKVDVEDKPYGIDEGDFDSPFNKERIQAMVSANRTIMVKTAAISKRPPCFYGGVTHKCPPECEMCDWNKQQRRTTP